MSFFRWMILLLLSQLSELQTMTSKVWFFLHEGTLYEGLISQVYSSIWVLIDMSSIHRGLISQQTEAAATPPPCPPPQSPPALCPAALRSPWPCPLPELSFCLWNVQSKLGLCDETGQILNILKGSTHPFWPTLSKFISHFFPELLTHHFDNLLAVTKTPCLSKNS